MHISKVGVECFVGGDGEENGYGMSNIFIVIALSTIGQIDHIQLKYSLAGTTLHTGGI